MASTVQAKTSIEKKIMNVNGTVEENMDISEIGDDNDADNPYYLAMRAKVLISNITDDIYIRVVGDNGINRTYYYSDTENGNISFDSGDTSSVIKYTITIYSNRVECPSEELRTINLVVPMQNPYSLYSTCASIPDYAYCQEFIEAPFLASESEIANSISQEYQKYVNNLKEEEEEKNKTFFEKIGDFFKKYQVIIYSIIGIVIVVGALTTVVIIKRRRSRVL